MSALATPRLRHVRAAPTVVPQGKMVLLCSTVSAAHPYPWDDSRLKD
jgi:hypothetical protein